MITEFRNFTEIFPLQKPKNFFFQKYLACVAAIYFNHDMNYPFNCKEEKQTHNSTGGLLDCN